MKTRESQQKEFVKQILEPLMKTRWYGEIIVKMQDGIICLVKVSQNIKLDNDKTVFMSPIITESDDPTSIGMYYDNTKDD